MARGRAWDSGVGEECGAGVRRGAGGWREGLKGAGIPGPAWGRSAGAKVLEVGAERGRRGRGRGQWAVEGGSGDERRGAGGEVGVQTRGARGRRGRDGVRGREVPGAWE